MGDSNVPPFVADTVSMNVCGLLAGPGKQMPRLNNLHVCIYIKQLKVREVRGGAAHRDGGRFNGAYRV
jgi:hypothetical protein